MDNLKEHKRHQSAPRRKGTSSFEISNTIHPTSRYKSFISFKSLTRPLRTMHPANGETTTTTTTTEIPHAAMSWTACYDDGCFVHLHEKQGAYFPQRKTRTQPQRKSKKVRWGETIEEPKIHHEVGTFVVQLQEEMLRMADEIGRLKQETKELKKRVVMAEEAARKAEIEKERRGYEKLDVQIQFRTLATAVAKLAKQVDNDPDYAEFVGYVDPPKKDKENGAEEAQE